jgi:hypothetical protein
MKRILSATLLVLAAGSTAALAQPVPEESQKDLWCGLAFTIVAEGAPTDVTEDQRLIIQQFAEGGDMLVGRAKASHLENGYSEETFAPYLETLKADVEVQVNATDKATPYSFEECSALLGL